MTPGKKNILIITFTSPYPATDGGKISIFGTINYLRKHFNITVIFRTSGNKELENITTLSKLWPEVAIHNVHTNTVASKNNFTYLLKKGLRFPISLFKKLAATGNIGINSKDSDKSIGRSSFFPFLPVDKKFINYLEKLFEENFYDIIQVEYSRLLNIVSILPEKPKKIFVQIENRYTLLEDLFKITNDRSLFSRYIIKNAMFTELNLMREYDYIFSLNKEDERELSRHLPKDKIFVAPFPVLDSMHSENDERNFEPKKLVFLGPQYHVPNEDAVKWFIETIYPGVNLKLYVTGRWEASFTKKYPQVKFTGFIEDLSEIMRNSIIISPIRLGGGGIRAKVLQAMAMKCPVISTSLSCMGLESLEHGKNIFIADSSADFIAAVNKLENDKDLCQLLIANGYNLVEKFYSEKAAGEIRKQIYNNITGSSDV